MTQVNNIPTLVERAATGDVGTETDKLTNRPHTLMATEDDLGNVNVLSFGWITVAKVVPESGKAIVFTGHHGEVSPTVSRHVTRVREHLEESGVEVVESENTPIFRSPNDKVNYANKYIGDFQQKSNAEQDIFESVRENLRAFYHSL